MGGKEDPMVRTRWLKLCCLVLIALTLGERASQAQPMLEKLRGEDRVKLAVSLGHPAQLADRPQRTFLKIALEGIAREATGKRAPVNVSVVLDRSSSMAGDRLERAKQAAAMVIDRLTAEDIVSIVAYDDTASVVVPATAVRDPAGIGQRITEIESTGSTALFAGVSKGAFEVRKYVEQNRVNRVVLLSDGMANIGPSSPEELGELGRSLAKQGISVTTIGLGDGYNEDLMVALARQSDGNHGYARTADDLARIFQLEFASQAEVVARDARLTVRFESGMRPVRALGRDAEIIGQTVSARINEFYPKQERYLLLEGEGAPGKSGEVRKVASVDVRYVDPATKTVRTASGTVDVAYVDSSAEVDRQVNKDVMATGATLVANEANKQAVALRDQGKTDEAVALLERNAVFLEEKAREYGNAKLRKDAEMNRTQQKRMPSPAWNDTRKEMRKKQFQYDFSPAEL
jgi:Ca-activated chloride channel family protein